jgi:hypothetical protein
MHSARDEDTSSNVNGAGVQAVTEGMLGLNVNLRQTQKRRFQVVNRLVLGISR